MQRNQRPTPVPHTELNGTALRETIVNESKAREADRDAIKSPSWTAIYRPATAKGLNASDVQALARKRYGVERHDKLKADDMIDFADYISGTDAETLMKKADFSLLRAKACRRARPALASVTVTRNNPAR